MIIIAQDIDGTTNVDTSDAASTNTLVSKEQRIPPHLVKLIFASLFMSTLAFSFSILNSVDVVNIVSDGVVAPILAYIFTLPHHGAALLLKWLQHHDMASILSFSPTSTRSLWYSAGLVILWLTSVSISCRNINYTITFEPADLEWSAEATVVTSVLEFTLILAIALVCFLHYRRQQNPGQQEPPTVAEHKSVEV
ncbi:hypothetical protein JR316_0006024 [Psilocybe cubensis]|uniref:Uncharacterized protein n=2 Tax=Psilocybe cubensis TaxID=181762 RepID=A0A8H7Y0N0_PSICU|nr:hypothetical protein JR316_0006024 [Psilocybe cubensis]KAH9481497.1 hypothetical protein JR316_0006024 [Psilocybe cubensis]